MARRRSRFLAHRLDGLSDEPRPGVPRTITDVQGEEVVVRTLEEVPAGSTHWSKRELARPVGISPTSVASIWRAFGLQPWRTQDFKISTDPLLIDKTWSGCIWPRAAHAAVFAVDEKPQIQALQRSAPALPMLPGVPERRSFDHVRHGTVDLFAALNTATGKVIGKLSARHRAVDFRDFLDEIVRQVEPGLGAGQLLLLGRSQGRVGGVDQSLERGRQAVQVDQDRRPDPRPHLPLLRPNLKNRLTRVTQPCDAGPNPPPGHRIRGPRDGDHQSGRHHPAHHAAHLLRPDPAACLPALCGRWVEPVPRRPRGDGPRRRLMQ
ncbi:IS630 family transposase [Nonomuraea sp. NPDC001684]